MVVGLAGTAAGQAPDSASGLSDRTGAANPRRYDHPMRPREQQHPLPADPGPRTVLAVLAALGAVALFLHDISNANRPHELHWAPVVTLLAAASAVLSIRAITLHIRVLKRRATILRRLVVAMLLAITGITGILFAGGLSTTVGNWFG